MAKAHIKRLQRQAARVSHLNALIDSGDRSAAKTKKSLQNHWEKRGGDVKGFFDHKKARAAKRNPVTVL